MHAKTDASDSTAELALRAENPRQEGSGTRIGSRQLRKLSLFYSLEEAEGLKAELKTDLAEIRALNKQLVTGEDKDDEAEIAEVDRVRADALRAFEAFLQ